MNKVTIVIPCYNIEDCIEDCLRSIMNQSYTDIEIIVVDDGSTDNSGLICDNLAKEDHRIKVIHQSNKGVSESRNEGIRNATGEYIQFVDGDDTLSEDCIEKTVSYLSSSDADICLFGYRRIDPDGTKTDSIPYYPDGSVIDGKELAEYCLRNKNEITNTYVWNKMSRLSLIKDKNIFFDKEIIYSEDAEWISRVVVAVSSCCVIASALYQYKSRRNGSTQSKVYETETPDLTSCIYMKSAVRSMKKAYKTLKNNDFPSAAGICRRTFDYALRGVDLSVRSKQYGYLVYFLTAAFFSRIKYSLIRLTQ